MKKIIIAIMLMAFCVGCRLPYPSVGVEAPLVVETCFGATYEKICTPRKNPAPGKVSTKTHCRWVRTR